MKTRDRVTTTSDIRGNRMANLGGKAPRTASLKGKGIGREMSMDVDAEPDGVQPRSRKRRIPVK